ncbi:SDR family NAD(P)-dependent oxidoreductase [Streptomyces caniscabiei]|uniref:SDR family NAD(P)-dependent oxidoreductase n=1 Tax=Streptomyces caniscabiei TaxID=2746961 RepID=UPI0029A8CFEF|nr:SDR family NAD(P)-dependent oxidoreductase [Streptomyces caniscabiei]MDX2604424.1 SDR family NAD(P)-dependent oxidoreductase [Streptomyces caniscabiei]MDX2735766.1 SDR family NAD(P)-dependent oxidoreductase [Streptomyces caniscabiei]MDX2782700.1 SDR family NAD(P)-dependent oxidoreductase [Streptomyces caniscabiei]
MSTLTDAVVVVTGGATGVGLALAREAAARGARLMIADVEDASAAVESLRADGATAEWLRTDTTDYAQVKKLTEATVERFGTVNVVCNNAGIGVAGALQDVDPAEAKRTFDVNVLGMFHVVHAFAPLLKDAAARGGPAYILNTGSEHSLGVPPHVLPMSTYTTSKYAALGLTDTTRRDLKDFGVGVCLLTPGWVRTERIAALVAADPLAAAAIEPFAQEPAEVAAAAFDGLLKGTAVIATNPHTRAFAMEHARDLMADIQALPLLDGPHDHAHDGTGDPAKCPFTQG